MINIRYQDIDWNRVWQKARAEGSAKRKTADDWDSKAPSFARRNAQSVYNNLFIEKLQADPSASILDVGCGPGTLAIPLARRGNRITALDFSNGMLALLNERAREESLDNITTHNLSWEDDWEGNGIDKHDIAIASRSLAVPNLRSAIEKLTRFASKEIVITDRVRSGPFDPDAFRAVGRELKTGPDYIITLNLLYQMGILAKVDFIRLENSHHYSSFEEAMANYNWMFNEITKAEEEQLAGYVRTIAVEEPDHSISLHPQHITTWALIRWSPGW